MENNRNLIVGVIVILLIAAGVIALIAYNKNKKDETVTPVLSVSSFNKTKNVDASSTSANGQDIIVFTLTAENHNDEVIPGYVMEANISELIDKSTLTEASGASYNSATNSLVWTPLDIPANGSVQKQFAIQVNSIAAGSSGTVLKMKFGNEITVAISANPTVAGTNTIPKPSPAPSSYQAPTTGPSTYVIFLLALLVTGLIAWYRKSLMAKN